MRVLAEKEAEELLEKGGFNVVQRSFCFSRYGLRKSIKKIGFPFVLKAYGRNLFSKSKVEGVKSDVKTYTEALLEFKNLKKIKGSRGVLVQRKIKGKEFFVGLKRDSKSKFTVSFGFFVLNPKGEKEVVLRIFPAVKKKVKEIIKEANKHEKLSKKEKKSLEDFILEFFAFINKNKKISEIIADPLIVDGKNATVTGAKVVFG
ncbi:acetate--CoA ligase family protein [Candidatus Pacearchaeota archaeon]|nr:acetate--CoA ligase family protein [Candidatus Pacearchaeota archaeon]